MQKRLLIPALSALILTVAAVITIARGAEAAIGDLTVTQAWARATPPGASTGAVYVSVENHGASTDRLVSVKSPVAQSAMVHETVVENGVSSMRMADASIAPGAALEMKPGGVHIMLTGLKGRLREGDSVDLDLVFEKAGEVRVKAPIGPIGADAPMAPMQGMQ